MSLMQPATLRTSGLTGDRRPKAGFVPIIDDDKDACVALHDLVASWGMRCRSFSEVPSANDWLELESADVFLVDVHMPGINGLDLIPEISVFAPDAKVVIITGCADKATAIKALRLGAFDFLEKPVQAEFLYHSICSAMEAQRRDRNLRRLIADLKKSESDLMAGEKQLSHMNSQLMETNTALSTLTHNMEMEREETERRIALKIGAFIMPAIEKLRNDGTLVEHALELDMLARTMEDLTSGFIMSSKAALALSSSELRVASLIKHGLKTDEIAAQLRISQNTVKAHRKNIRRKLRINNAQYNLKNYLLCDSDIMRKR